MSIRLYDLCMADSEIRPSPYCWTVKFALLHKGLDYETTALTFTEKQNYPDPDYGRLPVIEDEGEIIRDSAVITEHLERKYRSRALLATPGEAAALEFYRAWLMSALFPAIGPMAMIKVHDLLDDAGKTYFRETREKRFGKTLEELAADPKAPARVEAALATLAGPLSKYRFLGGDGANLCDYVVFGPLMWRRVVARETPYKVPTEVEAWMERMLDLFGGFARGAKRAGAQ